MNKQSNQKIYSQTPSTTDFYGNRTVYNIERDEWGNETGIIKTQDGEKKVSRTAGSNEWYF